jgi:hypothetical protein
LCWLLVRAVRRARQPLVGGVPGEVLDLVDDADALRWHAENAPCCATVRGMLACPERKRLAAQVRDDRRRAWRRHKAGLQ